MGWPGDCLAHRSGFQFAKAHFVGGYCITSCASGFRACDIHLGFVKDVETQLIGLVPSACSEIHHRSSEKEGKDIPEYAISGYRGVQGKDVRGFRSRYGKGGGWRSFPWQERVLGLETVADLLCSHLPTILPHALQTQTCGPCPKTISAFVHRLPSFISCNIRTHQIINLLPFFSRVAALVMLRAAPRPGVTRVCMETLGGVFCSKCAPALFASGIKPLIAAATLRFVQLLPLALCKDLFLCMHYRKLITWHLCSPLRATRQGGISHHTFPLRWSLQAGRPQLGLMQRSFLGRGYAGNAGQCGGRGAKGKSLSAVGVSSSLSTWGTSQHSRCPGNREDGDVPTVGRYLETWGTARRFRELALPNGWGSPGGEPSLAQIPRAAKAEPEPSPHPPHLLCLLCFSWPPDILQPGVCRNGLGCPPPRRGSSPLSMTSEPCPRGKRASRAAASENLFLCLPPRSG